LRAEGIGIARWEHRLSAIDRIIFATRQNAPRECAHTRDALDRGLHRPMDIDDAAHILEHIRRV
jgi:hypothetical protein